MLQAKDLAIRRAERMVIEGANIAIRPGAITAICGPNGAGKSSLLAGLAGLLRPVRGELSIDGKSLDGIAPRVRARTLGFLPQDAEAAWDVDVKTLVGLGRMPWRAVPGRPARAAAQEDRSAVGEAMSAMELGALADRPLSTLSGGERARAMMARVLAGKPRYILADEPFASLDIGHARDLARLLREQAGQGRGLAVVMHDLALAMNIADTVIVLDAGRIVADAPPEQALSAETIARVWRADVRWLGQAGARALSIGTGKNNPGNARGRESGASVREWVRQFCSWPVPSEVPADRAAARLMLPASGLRRANLSLSSPSSCHSGFRTRNLRQR